MLCVFKFHTGVNRFLEDLKYMLGFKLNLYWKISWWIVTPITLVVRLINRKQNVKISVVKKRRILLNN